MERRAGGSRHSRLRTAILLPLFSLVLLGFLVSGTIYILASRAAVGDVVERLILEATTGIGARVSSTLESPRYISMTVAEMVLKIEDPGDYTSRLQQVFRSLLAGMPELNIVAVGFVDGEYAEAQRLSDGTILIGRAGRSTGGALESWTSPEGGEPQQLRFSRPGYDPRTRPWYRRAVESGKPGWSDVYAYFSTADLAVSASVPVLYGDEVKAVVAATVSLRDLMKILVDQPKARRGTVAVLDQKGRLISTSDLDSVVLSGDGGLIPARESSSRLLAEVAGLLPQSVRSEGSIVHFQFEGDRYIAGFAPIDDQGWGLGWTVVTAVPESFYMERLLQADVTGGFVFFLLLGLATMIAWITVDGITDPLLHLETAAADLAGGRFSGDASRMVQSLAGRRDEIGLLAASFAKMSGSLESSFESLRASLEEKEVLIKEVHHRVKNNLQVVSSMLAIQAGEILDPLAVSIFKACQERIQAMALVHEEVYQSGLYSEVDMSEYLERICSSLRCSRTAGTPRLEVRVDAKGIRLPLAQAIPSGLIVNELVVNSIKHAFPSDRLGTVGVSLKRAEGRCLLAVQDDG
ncbi:MAG TPA: histidine kinase dimerization/phosphoacceptor domain -containing protein, partial [Magnetospirillaceae bacterium]|nr:histidine kinase dimerization/phosphoacceptor domain -containing protein [Magnetospirillaceae bacterium]